MSLSSFSSFSRRFPTIEWGCDDMVNQVIATYQARGPTLADNEFNQCVNAVEKIVKQQLTPPSCELVPLQPLRAYTLTNGQCERIVRLLLKVQFIRDHPEHREQYERLTHDYADFISLQYLTYLVKSPHPIELQAAMLAACSEYVRDKSLNQLDGTLKQKLWFFFLAFVEERLPRPPYNENAINELLDRAKNEFWLMQSMAGNGTLPSMELTTVENKLKQATFFLTYLPFPFQSRDFKEIASYYYLSHCEAAVKERHVTSFELKGFYLLAPMNRPPYNDEAALRQQLSSCFPHLLQTRLDLDAMVKMARQIAELPESRRLYFFLASQLFAKGVVVSRPEFRQEQTIKLHEQLIIFFNDKNNEAFRKKIAMAQLFLSHCQRHESGNVRIDLAKVAYQIAGETDTDTTFDRFSSCLSRLYGSADVPLATIEAVLSALANNKKPLELFEHFLLFYPPPSPAPTEDRETHSSLAKHLALLLQKPNGETILRSLTEPLLLLQKLPKEHLNTFFAALTTLSGFQIETLLSRIGFWLPKILIPSSTFDSNELAFIFRAVLVFPDNIWKGTLLPRLHRIDVIHCSYIEKRRPPFNLMHTFILSLFSTEEIDKKTLKKLCLFMSDWHLSYRYISHFIQIMPKEHLNDFFDLAHRRREEGAIKHGNNDVPMLISLTFPDAASNSERINKTSFDPHVLEDNPHSFAARLMPFVEECSEEKGWQEIVVSDELSNLTEILNIILAFIEPSKRQEAEEHIAAFFNRSKGSFKLMVGLLSLIPPERRGLINTKALTNLFPSGLFPIFGYKRLYNLNSAIDERKQWEEIDDLLTPLTQLFCPKSLHLLVDEFDRNPSLEEETMENILSHMMSKEEIRTASRRHLLQCFGDPTLYPEELHELTRFILEHHTLLQINNSDPFYLAVHAAHTRTSSELLKSTANPYFLFLRQEIQSEKAELLPVTLPAADLVWNLEKLRKGEKPKSYTKKDLPEETKVNSKTVEELLGNLRTRINGQSEEKKEEINNYVQENYLYTLEGLLYNWCHSYFQELLSENGEVISSSKVYLYRILKAIKEQKNEVVEGSNSPLTPQEEMLLKLSNSLLACGVGKAEGLRECYNLLPVSYRCPSQFPSNADASSVESDISVAEPVANPFVVEQLQRAIEDTLKSKALMMALIEKKDVGQLAHQTLYLKNEFAHQIGLQHRVAFDPNSQCILRELLEVSPEKFLNTFFSLFTPEIAFPFLCKELTEESFKEISRCFRSHFGDNYSVADFFEIAESDEMQYRLTPQGRQALILATKWPVEMHDKAKLQQDEQDETR